MGLSSSQMTFSRGKATAREGSYNSYNSFWLESECLLFCPFAQSKMCLGTEAAKAFEAAKAVYV